MLMWYNPRRTRPILAKTAAISVRVKGGLSLTGTRPDQPAVSWQREGAIIQAFRETGKGSLVDAYMSLPYLDYYREC